MGVITKAAALVTPTFFALLAGTAAGLIAARRRLRTARGRLARRLARGLRLWTRRRLRLSRATRRRLGGGRCLRDGGLFRFRNGRRLDDRLRSLHDQLRLGSRLLDRRCGFALGRRFLANPFLVFALDVGTPLAGDHGHLVRGHGGRRAGPRPAGNRRL
ncbi:MAG TPA: hypothetical protein VHN38_10445, partial [Immundisolibacter sp.]|nr:hypothetical protein [Immundisolibacter sp.]